MENGYDLVIRGGTIADGSGAEPFQGDIAIKDGVIVELGSVAGAGAEEIDATGYLVTPGFVDIHTHLDGQATWAERMTPSSEHGVTTVVLGNCGIGFAPCKPADQGELIRMMEGVEDIPGAVMAEGLPWKWETFPEFLEFLAGRQFDADVAAYLPHAPLRTYVMGQRGLDREPATENDLDRMAEIIGEAMDAGALGVATSRSLNHRSSDQHLLPAISAAETELIALGRAVKSSGDGLFQFIADFESPENEFGMMRRVAESTGVPMTFSLVQAGQAPDRWRTVLKLAEDANNDGVTMMPQVFPRPIGFIIGMYQHFNFFSFCPSYEEIKHLPIEERLVRMRDPELRKRITSEFPTITLDPFSKLMTDLSCLYPMAEHPTYEPELKDSITERAKAMGVEAVELAYDMLIENDGHNVFYWPIINYSGGKIDAVTEMINHRDALIGLGDGGAHVGLICDASGPTYMLQRWVGDGTDGTMPVEKVVNALTWKNANAVNLRDRGLLKPGYRADINIIDIDSLCLHRPEMVYDLPLGGGRFAQHADGYIATLVAGEVTYRMGKPTDRLPGRLVRGAQPVPALEEACAA